MLDLHLASLVLSALVALRGTRSKSLSASGALAAAVLGYVTLASPVRLFGVCLLSFYLAGSKATKVKAHVKATLDQSDHADPQAGPRRSAAQVACNALVGALSAVLWRAHYSGELDRSQKPSWPIDRWCVVERYPDSDPRRLSRVFILAAVAFWSACCGDTFASELGILAKASPILITRPFSGSVPRGTNGGVTLWGLCVSLLGGIWVGTLAVVCLVAQGQPASCNSSHWAIELVSVAGLSGLGGSLLDSLLGALLQPTYYSARRKVVVRRQPHAELTRGGDDDDKVVCVKGTAVLGPWLSNNGVNFVMGLVTSLVAASYAYR